ncbi:uncharacterized protein LOC129880035 isoform X1 [Solanum dulcamara]|uniref:uncharacterized protein LOC129880035 isoform X1 n=1 Tax=Solanum dulcamara TaxID=45834 RepID=UPI0024850E1B|nr:uncharacterized protein LOC129880035 isoform X1 [Solanum dulcamara]
MSNMVMWLETNDPPIEPLEVKPMPGRPIRCRRKDKDEPRKKKWGKSSKNGVKMSCSKCHQVGHNKRSCKSVPGRPSERVISSGSQAALKDAPQTNVDHGFKPSGLKWKEKNAMTGNHFQLMSQRNKLQIKSKRVP